MKKVKFPTENFQYVNSRTGEILNEMPLKPMLKFIPFEEWMLTNTEFLRVLVKDKDLTCTDFRLLFYLASVATYENYVFLTQTEMAIALETTQSVVYSSLKKLRHKGIVVRGSNRYGKNCYRLNPDFTWRGSGKVLTQELEKTEKDRSDTPFDDEFVTKTSTEKPITQVKRDGEIYLVDAKGKIRGKLDKSAV